MDNSIEQLESQVATLQRRLDEAEASVKRVTAERDKAVAGQHLAAAAAAAGVAPAAIADVVDRALRSGQWKADSKGRLVRHREDGFADLDGQANPITPRSVIESFRSEAPFYWPDGAQAPAGASARPAASGKPSVDLSGMENPWQTFNLTRQGEIYRDNPELAQRLADAVGVPVIVGGRVGSR
jgi:hypothetical protein